MKDVPCALDGCAQIFPYGFGQKVITTHATGITVHDTSTFTGEMRDWFQRWAGDRL